ncbi:MAG: dipeptidase [Anaerolineaceae bacterium]|nr:dipeptidase [Anaerolineaceae bacterium]
MSNIPEPNLFDYGLDEAQEERARQLHKESIIIDMLFQGPISTPVYTAEMEAEIKEKYEEHRDIERSFDEAIIQPIYLAVKDEFPQFREWWDVSGITGGNRQLDMDTMAGAVRSMASATMQFDHFDWLIKALNGDDIRRAKAEGKCAGFITAQNTVALGQDLDNLNLFHMFGLRLLQLTYNSMNFVGVGCTERTDAGVSSYGVKFIERMNELGIVVDTGHVGRQTTLDAVEISTAPTVASHTCAQAISGHARGKSDVELEAIARSGGVIGVVTVPTFLNMQEDATMEDFMDHVDYIAKLVGPEYVGIGTDWPMSLPRFGLRMLTEQLAPRIGFRPQDKIPMFETVDGFADYREFNNITRGLVARGYSDEEIKGILGENWLRVIDQVW